MTNRPGRVVGLARGAVHAPSKACIDSVRFLAGLGIAGDAHAGKTVQHRSRVAVDPTRPNLRQVHLMGIELLEELREAGYDVSPGRLGENVLTEGIDLLSLPTNAQLLLGDAVILIVTGLRNPCAQLDQIGPGLMRRLAPRDPNGRRVRRAGVMAIVLEGGEVKKGDAIRVQLPPTPHVPLQPV